MLNRFASVLLAAGLACAAAPALAQAPTSVGPVTVQGQLMPKVVQRQARDFVHALAAPTAELGQIARWRDPVCVQVFGLRAEVAARVKARVEEVAKAVDRGVDAPGCRGNIEIVFSEKPQRLLDGVARKRELMLGYYHRHDLDKLKTVTRPIQAWYITATLGGGGNTTGAAFAYYEASGNIPLIPIQLHREVIDDPGYTAPTGCGISAHFTACLQSVFKNVLVVADASRLQGKDIGLLTDYIVMVALAQPRSLDGCASLPSIVDLFAAPGCPGRDAPNGLTPADASYLTSLYQADPEARLAFEQGDIAGRMSKILINASASRP